MKRFFTSSRLRGPVAGALFVVATQCVGCSDMALLPEPKRIEEVRTVPPVFKATTYTIQRRDLKEALTRSEENTFRLVPVYQSSAGGRSFEHRIFDVKPKSVYALMGIESADIVVAVDGFLVKRPDQLAMFTQVLLGQDQATIEIRRNGEARLLKYYFVPSVTTAPPPPKE